MDERRKLLAEIEQEFSARVIHQVKTPLALMHGYALTLLEHDLPDEQRRWFLEVIAKQSSELALMLDRLEELRRLHQASSGEVGRIDHVLELAAEEVGRSHPQVELQLPDHVRAVAGMPAAWLARALEESVAAFVEAGSGEVSRLAIRDEAGALVVEGSMPARRASLGVYLATRILEHFGGSLEMRDASLVLRFPTAG